MSIFKPIQFLYQHIKKSDPRLFETLDAFSNALVTISSKVTDSVSQWITKGKDISYTEGTVNIKSLAVTDKRPILKIITVGGTLPAYFGESFDGQATWAVNLYSDGTNWNLDDISVSGVLLLLDSTGFTFYTAPAGPNPVALSGKAFISFSGDMDILNSINTTSGVYRVGGVQVLKVQQAAVANAVGGGTSITAPSGGIVIDVEARTAIAALITAVSSLGDTVDTTARSTLNALLSRLRAATGHGIIG